MNFESIKKQLDDQNMDDLIIPRRIKELKSSEVSVKKISKRIKYELTAQTAAMLVFFAAPAFIELIPIARGIYLIIVFIIALISSTYLIRLELFRRRSLSFSSNTRDVLASIIEDLKLTLEVYKSAVISSSYLLPVVVYIVARGTVKDSESDFMDVITLNIATEKILMLIAGYILIAVAIYQFTVLWTRLVYGRYLTDLEYSLEKIDSE